MTNFSRNPTWPRVLSRRRFVKSVASGAAMAFVGGHQLLALGELLPQTLPELSGTQFDLNLETVPVNFTGHRAVATGINGTSPGPTLRWREGDTVTIAVTNLLATHGSIHWHGIRLPAPMDGVPGLSFRGIAPGETFVYRLPVRQRGTYWYHSHSHFQEQTGLLGAIVIEPSDPDPVAFDRAYVVLLTDWTDHDPETIFSNLKQESDYYNHHRQTLGGFLDDAKEKGLSSTISEHMTWARMNMSPNEIADVSGAAYTYLVNGHSPGANWTALFRPGERVRLRFINGSSMTLFDVRIPGLPMTVVEADGNAVEPFEVDEFRMGAAETYDVIVQPQAETAYTIFAQAEDRTGFARATLTPRLGLEAAVPPMDPCPQRTMMDMGMDMSSMQGMSGMENGDANPMPGMNASGMSGMQTDAPTPAEGPARKAAMSGMQNAEGSAIGTTPFPQPGPQRASVAQPTDAVEVPRAVPIKIDIGPEVGSNTMHGRNRLK